MFWFDWSVLVYISCRIEHLCSVPPVLQITVFSSLEVGLCNLI